MDRKMYRQAIRKELNMKELIMVVCIVVVWYVLQAHILPRLGIST